MPLGPVELLAVRFPGNRFTGGITPALSELVANGTVRIIDIVFLSKDGSGEARVYELNDLIDDDYATFDPIVSEVTGILSEDDIRELSGGMDDNSSVALMLFENTWATRFRDAVLEAKGELMLSERVPQAVVEEIIAARAQHPA
jgi:hypothetical protein